MVPVMCSCSTKGLVSLVIIFKRPKVRQWRRRQGQKWQVNAIVQLNHFLKQARQPF